MLVALLIGIPTGVLSAVRRGTAIDVAANAVALSGLSVPHFWLGIMLILLFAVRLGWLPASGYVAPWEDLGRNLTTILMPSFVLGTGVAGVMMRHTRGAMLQVLSTDYVRTARAKSVPERLVVLKHAYNALIPVITLGAIEFGRCCPARCSPSRSSPSRALARCWWTASSTATTPWCRGSCCVRGALRIPELLADVLLQPSAARLVATPLSPMRSSCH
jgi:hypothetical protein